MMKKVINLMEKGKFKEAEDILRPIIEESPTHTEALFNLALARRDQDDVWEAMELMRQAIKTQPRNATLYFALGNIQLGIPDYDEAEKNFLKAAGFDPNNVNARNGIAFLDIRQNRFKAAEHSLMIALNIEPDNLQALIFLGIALLEQDQYDRAIEHLQKAVKLDSNSVQAQFCLGRALLSAGNPGFAVQCFENAAKGEPQTAEFKDWLGCAQLNNGQLTEAKESFLEAISMGRINEEVLTGLVNIETLQGNTEEALATMLQAVQLDPGSSKLALRYAEMLLKAGRFDEAEGHLRELLAADFQPEAVRVQLATVLMQTGDAEQALQTLAPLMDETGTGAVLQPESRLMLTWALQECGDSEGAAEQLGILLAMEKPLLDAVLFRARQMIDSGDDQSVELLRQVLQRDDIGSGHARQARILLAAALDQTGDYKGAAMEYRGLAGRDAVVSQIAEMFYQGERADRKPVSAMDPAVTADWPQQPPNDNRGDIAFVFSWPGSGHVQLLDALGRHPGLKFLSDAPDQQKSRLARFMERQGADGLGSLDETSIIMSRRHYWKAAGLDGKKPRNLKVIDPLWLTAEVLPAIARYFPGATVVVLTREPRDMAIAWMQTGYKDLEAMAAQYQSQMKMLQQCRTSLPLNFVEIDYDQLRNETENALNSVQQSLGLEPDVAVVDQFNQLTDRLPARSGDWKNYQDELAAVFDKFN